MGKWSKRADRKVVEAVVAAFHLPTNEVRLLLAPLTSRQWRKSYFWLDASGVALYLLERLQRSGLTDGLPPAVLARLKQNRIDNHARAKAMFAEYARLNVAFQSAGIRFCNLKGFTLSPDSCADPDLRRQIDLDFLVDAPDRDLSRQILEVHGYLLHGATSEVWEFTTESRDLADMSGFYKPGPTRCVELHFSKDRQGEPTHDERLDRLRWISGEQLDFPALASVDQFVDQAKHLFFHLCGHSTRFSWLLEFSQHIQCHQDEVAFWHQVNECAASDPETRIALGVACMMASLVLETQIPALLIGGSVSRLPCGVMQWVLRYGRRALLSDFPGTKLNLLLLDVLNAGDGGWKDQRQTRLFPRARAARILCIPSEASIHEKVRCEFYQVRYDLYRIRFHLTAGLEYAFESFLWRSDQDRQRDQFLHLANRPQQLKK